MLTWHPSLQPCLPDQHCSALMTSTFQAVAKCNLDLTPAILFRLRSWGLQCLIRSSSLKEDAFWDQSGKYCAAYVKAVGNEGRDNVASMLDGLFQDASSREDKAKFFQGRGFISICEYRLKFARAVSTFYQT